MPTELGLFLVDSATRFSAFAILLMAAGLLLRDASASWAGRHSAGFAITVAAYLLCSSPEIRAVIGAVHLVILALCLAGPALLWLTALALFEDDFEPRAVHFLPLALLEISGYARFLLPLDGTAVAIIAATHQLLVAGLYAHAIYVAWRGQLDDLVEARRELRRVFVGAVGVIGVSIAVVELWLGTGTAPQWLQIVANTIILIAAGVLLPPALKVDLRQLFPLKAGASAPASPARSQDRPLDQTTLVALERAIAVDRVYRREGVTINSLAAHLKTPEHQLRRVINQALGFRNFNAFLNHHRIAEVKSALANPERARIPVLTVALEAGYASLAPFNRAFKESEGLTPTEYRRQKLGAALQANGSLLIDSEKL